MDAHEPGQLPDELHGLALRDELAGLDAVDEELDLRQLEVPLAHVVPRGPAPAAVDVQTEVPQGLDVAVDALALGPDPGLVELADDVLRGQGMVLVALLQEHAHDVQDLGLLMDGSGHILSLL